MLLKQDFINKIKDYFDLNVYETKVWLALLGKGVASAGEVAELSGVPRSRTYDVLETLEKKGFAIVKLGKPVKYIGVKPVAILEKLKNNVKKETQDRISALSTIKESEEFSELEGLYSKGVDSVKRDDVSAYLKGKSIISNHLRETIQRAEKEVIICTSVDEINSKFRLFQQTFEDLKKNSVKIKLALSGEKDLIKKLEKNFGVKIKDLTFKTKFYIIDRKEIVFYLSQDKVSEDLAIWINSDFFVKSFVDLFENAIKKI